MKKLLLILFGLLLAVAVSAQSQRVYNQNIQINKTSPLLDLQGLGAKIYLDGATSGTATLQPPAIAGSAIHTLPSTTGTLINSADTSSMLTPYILDSEARTAIHDTIQTERDNAVLGVAYEDYEGGSTGNDYYLTPDQVRSYIGSGGGGAFTGDILKFIIGTTTGAPTTSDSTIIHSNFVNKHIDLYRDGVLAYWNIGATANTVEGFRKRTASDTIFVNPLWQDDEQVEIRIREPNSWEYLSLEGQESDLLDTLIVYYKFEDSGTTFDDAMDVQDASNSAANTTRTSTGTKFNYGRHIDYHGYAYMPYNASVNPDTIFSVSMWIYSDSIGATDYLFSALATGGAVSNPLRAYINSSGYLVFRTYNSAGTQYGSISNTTLSDSTLYHVCFVHRGNGKTNLIYLNGTNVTTSEGGINYTFSGDLYQSNAAMYIGNYTYNHAYNFRGTIDEAMIYHKILTQANVTALYELTAPLK